MGRKSKQVLAIEDRIRQQREALMAEEAVVASRQQTINQLVEVRDSFEQAETKRSRKRKPAVAAGPITEGRPQ